MKGCYKAIAFYILVMGIIVIIGILLAIWREHNPAKFCDELTQENIKEYNPIVCRLRYPILNIQEIQTLKGENDALKEQVLTLEYQLENIRNTVYGIEPEIYGQELMQIDY